MISAARFLLVVVGTAAYLGLAILGWGGLAPFFSHPALIALAIVLFALAGVSLFAGGNVSPGVREDRSNRWVLVAFGLIGLLDGYLPAWADRKDLWVLDGDGLRWLGVVLFAAGARCASGRSSCSAPASAGSWRYSPGTPWSPRASTASSATPAIWGCSSMRSGGVSPFAPESACWSWRS
jgi:hypothetical protein